MQNTKTSFKRAIWAGIIGNILEWFDFVIFVFFASYISMNFFSPETASLNKQINTLLIFSIGFIARPVGALVLGSYADTRGRKQALILTLLLMGIGTFLILISPSFEQIGWWAICILVLARLLQGFSSGGEIGSASAFLLEFAPKGKKSFYTAFFQSSMGIASILGSLLGFLLAKNLNEADMQNWAWRLPFLVGLLIIPIAWYIRKSIDESPEFLQAIENQDKKPPFKTLFNQHRKTLFLGIVFGLLWTATPFVYVMFFPNFLMSPAFSFPKHIVFLAATLGSLCMVLASPLGGFLIDKFGASGIRKIILILPIALFAFMWILVKFPTYPVLFGFYVLSFSFVSVFLGASIGLIANAFPVEVRSLGVASVYNLASAITGFTPVILTIFVARSLFAPQIYLLVLALIAYLAIVFLNKHKA